MRGVALFGLLISGCILYSENDDDVPWPDDGGPLVDAPPTDVPIDCGCVPDAREFVSGWILLYEVDQLDPESDGSFGQGLVADVNFARAGAVPPIAEEQPGSPLGCKVWRYSRQQAIDAVGLDEGTVGIELPGLSPQPVEPCTFAAGAGYTCPGAVAVTPGLADPGVLPDAQSIRVTLMSGGNGDIAPFFGTAEDIGDDFTLPPADLARLENMPRDGAAFTIGCDSALCNTGAVATVLEIVTTDAPTTGLSPFAMPLPTVSRTFIRCNAIGTPTVTVPAFASSFLQSSGATRIQTTYSRSRFVITPMDITTLSGHAIRGISN